MSYFVTGATGFIGRFLVDNLLQRKGTIHVLVRKDSEKKLDAMRKRWGGTRSGRRRRRRPREARSAASPRPTSQKLKGKVKHFFHLAAIYDLTAERRGAARRQHRRHAQRGALRRGDQGRLLPPHQLDRRRRPVRRRVPRGHVRRGRGPRRSVPPHQARFRRPGAQRMQACRGASTARASSSATRRPARSTRSTARTTSSR